MARFLSAFSREGISNLREEGIENTRRLLVRPEEITRNAARVGNGVGVEIRGRLKSEGKKGASELPRQGQEQEEGINCGREFVASLKYPPLSRSSNESHAWP